MTYNYIKEETVSFKSDSVEFDVSISERYFNLMAEALARGLCVRLEIHVDSTEQKVLLVKIYRTDRPGTCVFSKYSLVSDTDLFHKANNFVKTKTPIDSEPMRG